MIVEAILGTFVDFATGILTAILPVDDPDLGGSVTGIVHLYSLLNVALPLDETLQVIGLTLGVLGILGTIWVVTWVLQRFHIIGGSS